MPRRKTVRPPLPTTPPVKTPAVASQEQDAVKPPLPSKCSGMTQTWISDATIVNAIATTIVDLRESMSAASSGFLGFT